MSYILHISRWYPDPQQEDVGNFVKLHVSASAKNQKAVVFSIRKAESDFYLENTRGQIKEYLIGFRDKGNPAINALHRYWLSKRHLNRIIRKHGKPKLVHAHVHTRPVIWAERLSRKLNIPFVISEHWSGYCNGQFSNLPFLKRRTIKQLYQKACMILPVSPFLEQGMRSCGIQGNYQVLPNVVFTEGKSRRSNRGLFRFIFIGDLRDDIKNVSGIIKAFEALEEAAELFIIGEGQDGEHINQMVERSPKSKSIFRKPLMPHQEALEELALADALVINSTVETFSIIAAEAVAMGVPVLSSRCGGPEYFLHDQNAILFEPNNEEELIHGMSKIMSDSLSLPEEGAHRQIEKNFSLQAISEQLEEIYHSCI